MPHQPRAQIGFMPVSPPADLPAPELVERLEELGADSLWAAGHIASGKDVPEPITGLSWLAARTRRVTLGTAVLLAPLYHPVIVAKQLAQLDRATNGRVLLGVGVGGEYAQEFRACQVDPRERGPRTDEAIDVVKRLWREEHVDNHGTYWPFTDVTLEPRPARAGGPPVVVGGRKRPAMRRAATVGDGWMPFLYSPEQYAESADVIRDHAQQVGRDLHDFHWTCFVFLSLDADAAEARRRAAGFIGRVQAGDGSRFEAVVDRVAVAGTAEQVSRRLQAFVDAGARHFIVVSCDPERQVETASLLLGEIGPALRVPGD